MSNYYTWYDPLEQSKLECVRLKQSRSMIGNILMSPIDWWSSNISIKPVNVMIFRIPSNNQEGQTFTTEFIPVAYNPETVFEDRRKFDLFLNLQPNQYDALLLIKLVNTIDNNKDSNTRRISLFFTFEKYHSTVTELVVTMNLSIQFRKLSYIFSPRYDQSDLNEVSLKILDVLFSFTAYQRLYIMEVYLCFYHAERKPSNIHELLADIKQTLSTDQLVERIAIVHQLTPRADEHNLSDVFIPIKKFILSYQCNYEDLLFLRDSLLPFISINETLTDIARCFQILSVSISNRQNIISIMEKAMLERQQNPFKFTILTFLKCDIEKFSKKSEISPAITTQQADILPPPYNNT